MDDLDIYRSAKLMADLHGEGAEAEALKRADALAAKGDSEGESVWQRILEAVKELQNTEPVGAVHTTVGMAKAKRWSRNAVFLRLLN